MGQDISVLGEDAAGRLFQHLCYAGVPDAGRDVAGGFALLVAQAAVCASVDEHLHDIRMPGAGCDHQCRVALVVLGVARRVATKEFALKQARAKCLVARRV